MTVGSKHKVHVMEPDHKPVLLAGFTE